MDMNSYKREIKITLWGFTIGFVFSIALGLIVGNPIGISFIRAFIASILFAFVIFGTQYIIKRYIPELKDVTEEIRNSLKENKEIKNENSERGSKIDYVISDKGEMKKEDIKENGDINTDKHTFEKVLSDIERKDDNDLNREEKKEKSIISDEVSSEVSSNEEQDEELPPIEELLNEEEDIVPETEIEEETIASSESKVGGDYIKVGDIKIPNEPEIIAKAIKKVMKENE